MAEWWIIFKEFNGYVYKVPDGSDPELAMVIRMSLSEKFERVLEKDETTVEIKFVYPDKKEVTKLFKKSESV